MAADQSSKGLSYETSHQFAFTKPWKYSRNQRNGYSACISVYSKGREPDGARKGLHRLTGSNRQSPKVFRGFVVQINKHKQIIRGVRDTRDPSAKGTWES